MDDKKEFLTQKEMCDYLGIDESTFARNRLGEKIPCYKVGKRYKYKKSDAERLRIS